MNEVLKALLLRKLAGRGGGGGYPEPTGTKQITANGTGIDIKDFASADVNVPNTYAAGEEGKVVQSGALVAQTQKSVNANGTYDTTANNSVVVDVPTGGLKEYTSSALPKSTFKDWTTTFNAGNTLSVTLEPTDGTTVEVGDEVLVHGEITSSAGGFAYYVTGEVTSFDSSNKPVITVKGLGQPSPIADGLMVISSNGSSDVREFSSVSVNVQGSGTTYITENGTHDVGGYRYANVNVESGGGDVNILFATDATYNDQPVQGNSCDAEVPTADLDLYSAGDKVVLYGVEPNYTDKNFLVVGTITSFSYPTVVYFDVDEVSEISSGGGDKDGFVVLNNVTGDGDLGEEGLITIYPNSQEDLNGVNVGDSLLAKGSFAGGYYVVFSKVTEKYDNNVTASVIKALSSDNDGSTWTLDCSADSEPSDGEYITVILADSSSAGNLNQNDYLIGRLTVDGVDYAFYSQVDYVVDQGKGEVSVISIAHIAIPFS